MYGPAGERRLTENEVGWLAGYEGSAPVRIGNAAHGQFQLDVYGEVLDALHQSAVDGAVIDANTWSLSRNLVAFVRDHWQDPDDGIWEMRGKRRHFTHSKVMAWVAVDRAISTVEHFGSDQLHLHATAHHREVDLGAWRELRAEIAEDVLANGVDADGAFVQSYGSTDYDAALLLVPLVGFLPPDDDRVAATVKAVEDHLLVDGFVRRYVNTDEDGLAGDEATFLMCSFWLADNYALLGRLDEAVELFERLAGLCNDVGLLSEEYDPVTDRMLGNFPQAFSHVALVNTAQNLATEKGPAEDRGVASRR
jgi:GH15 family glucan-1,4-alpha-glucosidase